MHPHVSDSRVIVLHLCPVRAFLQAVGAFLGQYMSSSDLQSFFQELYPAAAGRKPTIIGPNQEDNPGIEANLDIQVSFVQAMTPCSVD